jgi:hypothetical protein
LNFEFFGALAEGWMLHGKKHKEGRKYLYPLYPELDIENFLSVV